MAPLLGLYGDLFVFVFAESHSNTVNTYWPGLARVAILFVTELHIHPSSGWLARGVFVKTPRLLCALCDDTLH